MVIEAVVAVVSAVTVVVGLGVLVLVLCKQIEHEYDKAKPRKRPEASPQSPTLETYLFHYATWQGAQTIHKARRIRGSGGGYGKGVYLTSLQPEEGKIRILENNFDRGTSTNHRDSFNYFFLFKKCDLPGIRRQESNHDFWIYPGQIILDCVDFVFGDVDANVSLYYSTKTELLSEIRFSS